MEGGNHRSCKTDDGSGGAAGEVTPAKRGGRPKQRKHPPQEGHAAGDAGTKDAPAPPRPGGGGGEADDIPKIDARPQGRRRRRAATSQKGGVPKAGSEPGEEGGGSYALRQHKKQRPPIGAPEGRRRAVVARKRGRVPNTGGGKNSTPGKGRRGGNLSDGGF